MNPSPQAYHFIVHLAGWPLCNIIYVLLTHWAAAPRDFYLGRDFGDLGDVVYRCQWQFGHKRTAFMVLLQARKVYVQGSFLDMALKDENPVPEIRSKNVITGIWSFAMYLSNKCGFLSVTSSSSSHRRWC